MDGHRNIDSERKKVVLIDAYSLIHRAFYALPPLNTSSGEPTNAVLGFANMLLALLEEEQPHYVAVAFDRSGPTFRDEMFDEYKANRPSMPDDLRPQIARTEQFLKAMNIAVFGAPGFEADDIIGTLTAQAREKDMDVLIVTGDRDMLQLVDDGVHVLVTRRGIREMERMDVQAVIETLGVSPERVVDLKGLMGDSSDNIPGVPRIGPKTAMRLLQQYGTLEDVLENAASIKGQVGENLRTYAEQARLSKKLATIHTQAPAMFDDDGMRRRPPDLSAMTELAQQLELRSLLDRIRKLVAEQGAGGDAVIDTAKGNRANATDASAESGERADDEPMVRVRVVRDKDELTVAMDELSASDSAHPLIVSVVAPGDEPMRAPIVGTLLSDGTDAVYAPIGHEGDEAGEQLPWDDVRDVVAPLLEDADVPKWCHDAKRTRTLLRRGGTDLLGVTIDTMLASYLINPEGSHALPDVALKYADRFVMSWKQRLSEAGATRRPAALASLSPDTVAGALAEEAELICELVPLLEQRLRTDDLWDLYERVELPLVDVLLEAEISGVRVDSEYLAELSVELDEKLQRLKESIYALAGEQFNINSPKQLSNILFEKLELPVVKRTKTGPSTDQEVLETLADEHELPALLLEYRHLTKLKSTYIDALPSLVLPDTGRVHTIFNQTVAATGRLSSTNPNLQNIPVRTEEGRRIRRAFIPAKSDWVLLKADYSQIELRVLAHISGDEGLIDAFRQGEDIHTRTAAEVFDIDPDQVTPDRRDAAKAINFGIVYGISSFGLAKGTGLTRDDAQHYIDEYFHRYPGVKNYIEKIKAVGREQGYVTTLCKRRRYLPDLKSRHFVRRSYAERAAMNTPIQGTAADIIKVAMVETWRKLNEEGLQAKLLLQVHDELVLELPAEEVPRAAALVEQCMANVVELDVPLVIDVEQGPNWLETERVTLDA